MAFDKFAEWCEEMEWTVRENEHRVRVLENSVSCINQLLDSETMRSRMPESWTEEATESSPEEDTCALVELVSFCRRLADYKFSSRDPMFCWRALTDFQHDAKVVLGKHGK